MEVDFIELVGELNSELNEDCYAEGLCYSYLTNGFVDIISFGDYQLYNSEIDSLCDIEEFVNLKTFIIHKMNIYKSLINGL